MPDFLTHVAAARVPGVFLRDRRVQALFILGTFMPDLVAKGLWWIVRAPMNFNVPSHSLPGLLAVSYLACLFLEERRRPAAFVALYLGGVLHVAVDLIKNNIGAVAYLLYPFSMTGSKLGWVNPENVVLLAPLNIALLLVLWIAERRVARVRR